jgi:DNA-3-methyladenine glycosylase
LTLTATGADDLPSEHPTAAPDETALARLGQAEVCGDAVTIAQRLLGRLIVRDDGHTRRVARIVETEAYGGPWDRASHARAGRTARTAVMFGPPGRAYVYLVYGMHHCLNVVCGIDGEAAAVLIRAVEPVAGVERMRRSRARAGDDEMRLAAGPARTCQALDIDRDLDRVDLLHDDRLWLARPLPGAPPFTVLSGPRIGVDYAGPEWAARRWRFGIAGSRALSKPFEAQS